MIKKFENIKEINDQELYDEISGYSEGLIQEATSLGYLSKLDDDNEYIREISRVGIILADYESGRAYENIKFKQTKKED